jgi:putative FmdB family regulatory protein
MPTYEYVCKACHHEWATEQRITEAPLKECPSCHEPAAQRQISGGNFILKGGGWYADLYSSSSKSSTSTKSDDKPAETKSETKTSDAPAKTPTSPPPKATT